MSTRNLIQTTFDEFGKSLGGSKKSGSWYVTGPNAIAVLNLQKSQSGPRYYLNVGLWFLGVAPAMNPKRSHCHVQSRLETLVPAAHRKHLEELLDLDHAVGDEERRTELLAVLTSQLEPLLEAGMSDSGLATEAGQHFLTKSLIDGDGQRFLAAQAAGS
ncbi:DUF4304 domain-containing protein [Arthrobacter sp. AZCC_0090]|uniref:DUF4304 domain-containing protein n=1 Tax=Arthrobacter sp. AZCC_0090 TaxID=2735881 RepID=UPI00160B6A1E|nr:DUF4304 domain-containing protein [Arthrobacter sp. AZCC_0090]MBB6406220.1 hypothetical protein [Arthrobacter sp. AZCC_0090]